MADKQNYVIHMEPNFGFLKLIDVPALVADKTADFKKLGAIACLIAVFAMTALALVTIDKTSIQASASGIIVNGRPIIAPSPVTDEASGTVLLPLRFVAEALGLVVNWDGAERRVDIGSVYSVWIESEATSRNGEQTDFGLTPAPDIIDGRTFVPVSFFNDVLKNIYVTVDGGVITVERHPVAWSVIEIPDMQVSLWAYPLGLYELLYETHYNVFHHESVGAFAIWTDVTVSNFELIEVGLGDTGTGMVYFYPGESLLHIPEFTPERPLAVRTHFGTMPRLAVTFLDNDGVRRFVTIQHSGMDGSIQLIPFPLDEPNPI